MGSAPESLEVLHILAYEVEYPLHILTSAGRVKCTDRHLCHALLPIHFSVHLSLAARATALLHCLEFLLPSFQWHSPTATMDHACRQDSGKVWSLPKMRGRCAMTVSSPLNVLPLESPDAAAYSFL